MNDMELLRDFVNQNSQTAFSKLVERHMGLVYGTCRRDVHDAMLAEDATQTVFVLLAQKAPVLPSGVSVSGWLFRTARLVSQNILRCEARRRRYEEEAMLTMEQQRTECDVDWQQVEPWINDALSALSEADRQIVLLRYFDDLSPQELAGQMGTTEATARKRVSRAVERLRRYLTKKEVPITSLTLAALLAKHPARTAPLSVAAVTQQALQHAGMTATAVVSSHQAALLHKGIHLTIQATKYKYLIAGAIVLLLGSLALPVALHRRQTHPAAATNDPATVEQRAITAQLQRFTDAYNRHDLIVIRSIIAPDAKMIGSNPQPDK